MIRALLFGGEIRVPDVCKLPYEPWSTLLYKGDDDYIDSFETGT